MLQREVDTMRFMQLSPWLGLIPGTDGQILQSQGESPVVNLLKSTTAAIVSNPNCSNPSSFYTLSKQAEAAGTCAPLCKSFVELSLLFVY